MLIWARQLLSLLALSIPIHEELDELSAGAEVCLHQPSKGIRKISKAMLGREIKNAQRMSTM
jgi:hypothetical protein